MTDAEIQTSVLNVGETINKLEVAYTEDPTAVKQIDDSKYKVYSAEKTIRISGLTAADKVSLFDIYGRQMIVTTPSVIKANAGVYIVKINDSVTKVVVK